MLSSLFITAHFPCVTDDDCPKPVNKLRVIKCIDHICQYARNLPDFASEISESTKMPCKGEWFIVQEAKIINVKYTLW